MKRRGAIRRVAWSILFLACLGLPSCARAATLMVVDDHAPIRKLPLNRAALVGHAPLGLVVTTQRTWQTFEFVEVRNEDRPRLEEPRAFHWMRPHAMLGPGAKTKVSLDLVLLARPDGTPELRSPRIAAAKFLSDSSALPDRYYVGAADPRDRSDWGGEAVILPPPGARHDPPGFPARKGAIRSEPNAHVAVVLTGNQPIRSVRERLAAARVLVREARCGDVEYVDTDVKTVVERTRTVGASADTVLIPVSLADLQSPAEGADVYRIRLVYLADVFLEDGSAEVTARRMVLTWPLCAP